MEENIDYNKLTFMSSNKKDQGLDSFQALEKLIKDIRNKNMTINKADRNKTK